MRSGLQQRAVPAADWGQRRDGDVAFREPISVAVGRAGAGERAAEPLLRVADWDRVYVLTLQGAPLQVIPVAGSSTRRVNGICLDADGEHLWLVSAERHSLCRFGAAAVLGDP